MLGTNFQSYLTISQTQKPTKQPGNNRPLIKQEPEAGSNPKVGFSGYQPPTKRQRKEVFVVDLIFDFTSKASCEVLHG